MEHNVNNKDSFTLPGEAGYEKLTLELAKKWGADVIRDSEGTQLSDEIVSSGYDIYSTICLVRADNEWAKKNMDKLQQNYLMSFPLMAREDSLTIKLLNGYFCGQFMVNFKNDPKKWWQVFDRTTRLEVLPTQWNFDSEKGTVTIINACRWHKYTVNFLVFRIWEEISMYNHITNDWGDKEHLMAIDPIYPEVQQHMLEYFEKWLIDYPNTNVIRFTAMFYNFSWFWGDNKRLPYVYSDWGSYNFTVNPCALEEFKKVKGYSLTSEDFVNGGCYNSTHNVPSDKYLD